jgi:membrane-bound metal-dependent hydrolase YbcI (DUF457 family)
MMTFLFVMHGLFAIMLIGAITHQAMGLWWPYKSADPNFLGRFRAVKAASYTNAIIILFLITFALGAVVYPTYRIGARVFMENLRMSAAVGSFEVKEHLVSFALGLLPAYWYFWRQPLDPRHMWTRKLIVLLMAVFIWAGFLVGHVLNNIRGV